MMASKEDLKTILIRIDGKGYKAYKDIEGGFDFGPFILHIDHVQGDPFAASSRLRFHIPPSRAGFPASLFEHRIKRIAFQDFVARRFETVQKKLVTKDKEPITPFVDKVKQLHRDLGVSTILVMGGSGDYFDVADTVIMMDNYQPRCVTKRAKEIARIHASKRMDEGGTSFGKITSRHPLFQSFDASHGRREVKIDAKGLRTILYGYTTIDLSCLEQLVDSSQTRAIGLMIHYYSNTYMEKTQNLEEGLTKVMEDIHEKGFDILLPYKVGDLAMPRIYELAGAINRMRTLKIK